MIVVDSSVWIAHFRDTQSEAVRKLRTIESPGSILIGDLVLLELLQGARDATHAERLERNLRELTIQPMLSPTLAVRAAAGYRLLRSRGITVRKTVDLIIAAFCIETDHLLLHNDRDFAPFAEHLSLRTMG